MDNQEDAPEVLETPEEVVQEEVAVEEEPQPQTDEEKEALIKERDELRRKNAQLYERAKKAEATPKKDADPAPQNGPSMADIYAMTTAKVHADDVARVEKFARDEGITIKQALDHKELKAILSVRSEERDSAAVANVSNVRRGPSKASDDTLLDNAAKGKLPESDDEIARLVKARLIQK